MLLELAINVLKLWTFLLVYFLQKNETMKSTLGDSRHFFLHGARNLYFVT